MVQMQRMLLLVLPTLLACTALGSSEAEDLAERALEVEMSMTRGGKGKGEGGKGKEEGGKGKGKGGKGKGDSSYDEYLSMSMDMSMGSSKSSKKSSKTSKSTKGSKKGGEPAPSPGGDGGKPSAPGGNTPTTPSPTSANSIPVRATPFALFYDGDFTRIPTDDEFASAAEVTRSYLEEMMIAEFEQTSLTNLDDFLTFMIRNSFNFGEPVQGDYRCTGLFNPSSIFLPTVRELNNLLDDAFQDDNLDEYVSRLQGLPSSNIFSTTSSVMKGLPDVPVPRTESDGSTGASGTFKMSLAAAAAGIVVLAAGAAMMKRQRSQEVLDDPYSDNLKGDAHTLAGETYTASIDGSAAWRKTSPYITKAEMDEGDFEDEPLESDDEQESRPPKRQSRQKGIPPKDAFTT